MSVLQSPYLHQRSLNVEPSSPPRIILRPISQNTSQFNPPVIMRTSNKENKPLLNTARISCTGSFNVATNVSAASKAKSRYDDGLVSQNFEDCCEVITSNIKDWTDGSTTRQNQSSRHQSQIHQVGIELKKLQDGLNKIESDRLQQFKPVLTRIKSARPTHKKQKSQVGFQPSRTHRANYDHIEEDGENKMLVRNEHRQEIYFNIDSVLEETKEQLQDKQRFRALLQQEQQQLKLIHKAFDKDNALITRANAALESELQMARELQVKEEAELQFFKQQAYNIKLQITNISIQHQAECQALRVENEVLSERLQVNKKLLKMEAMRAELTLSEQELQIQEMNCRISQKQDQIDSLSSNGKRVLAEEQQQVQDLAQKTHSLGEVLFEKATSTRRQSRLQQRLKTVNN